MSKSSSAAALGFIFLTLLLDVIGIGIIVPILPSLIEKLTHTNLSRSSQYAGWLGFSYAFMQFLFAPILGNLSDRYGRKPVLVISLLLFGIDYVFMAFAPSIFFLFLGRLISGITGSSFTTALAYIGDISTPKTRVQNFGIFGAAFGLGLIIGPALGGLIGQYGLRLPFIAAAVLSLINCAFGFFILPESLLISQRRPFEWKRANPLRVLLHLKSFPSIKGLTLPLFLINIATQAIYSVWTYYTIIKFGWNASMIGYSLGFFGLMMTIVQGGLIRLIVPKIGSQRAVYFGLFLYSIGFILFAFANRQCMMFLFIIPYCLGGVCMPSLQGVISSKIPVNRQGELQGTLASLVSLTSIIGPLLMTSLFAFSTANKAYFFFPGMPFLLAAALTGISSLLIFIQFRKFPVK